MRAAGPAMNPAVSGEAGTGGDGRLVLGPILRYVAETEATVWVETREPVELEIRSRGGSDGAPSLVGRARSFGVEGRHYALVEVSGLEPGGAHPYEVLLDGEPVWPPVDYSFPAPVIRPLRRGEPISLVFGSCRVTLPHDLPFVLDPHEDPEGQGIDALRALALRAARRPEALPGALLMLGDQIYADDLSPAMRALLAARERPDSAPADVLVSYEEYALAYCEAWSEPAIRWLLSTVPTSMIFDDHEIRAEWRISKAWLAKQRREPHYGRQVPDGLMAYWIYQHIGNLSPEELAESDAFTRVSGSREAGALLRLEMTNADNVVGHSRWSYYRDLGATRLIVIDARAGRELDSVPRKMVGDAEWDWILEHAHGDFDHLLLASSVPFFLTPGLHYGEAFDEALGDGVWGPAFAWLGERLRMKAVMDHWACFQHSFAQLEELLQAIVSGEYGKPPRTVVMLSGDVHHCYLAEIGFPAGTGTSTAVWQAVCSAYRKHLDPQELRVISFGNSRWGELLARTLARAAGANRPRLGWRITRKPNYENQIGILEATPDAALVRIETTAGSDWRDPRLTTVFEDELTPPGAGPDPG